MKFQEFKSSIMNLKIGCIVILISCMTFIGCAEKLVYKEHDSREAYQIAASFVKDCTPRDAGTKEGLNAAKWICNRLNKSGVLAKLDNFKAPTPDGICDFANVVVEIKSDKPHAPWIVLLSHFDTPPNIGKGFEGANDGASTTGLLMSLARLISKTKSRDYNFSLIWTDAEECRYAYSHNDGFQGSKYAAKKFRDMKYPVKAVICLDMLGDKDLQIMIPGTGSWWLRELAMKAAEKAGVNDKVQRRDSLMVMDDHSAFLEQGFSAIDLIDFEFGSAKGKNDYWHTPLDTIDKISEESLFTAGKLTVSIINEL